MNETIEQQTSHVAIELQKLDTAIERLKYKRAFLMLHQTAIEQMGLKPCCACDKFIDFDNPTRAQVVDILVAFGGKWSKALAFDSSTINYEQPIDGGLVLRLYHAEPPPSCQLVEEDVVIPAQPERIEKRTRLVCKEAAQEPEPYPVPDAYSVPAVAKKEETV